MTPDVINKMHILKAIKWIGSQGVPRPRKSRGYDLMHNNRPYPPKYVVSVAHRFAQGKEWSPSKFSGGDETNNYLIARGFRIVNKQKRRVSVRFQPTQEDDELDFPEGKLVFRRHTARERNSSLTRIAKKRRLLRTGDLACDVCDFSFAKKYGPRGKGFIEAHHTIPVSELRNVSTTMRHSWSEFNVRSNVRSIDGLGLVDPHLAG